MMLQVIFDSTIEDFVETGTGYRSNTHNKRYFSPPLNLSLSLLSPPPLSQYGLLVCVCVSVCLCVLVLFVYFRDLLTAYPRLVLNS